MYIQIDNAGFVNKGAELMLRAIIDRVGKEKQLNPHFVRGANCNGSIEAIMQAGLFQVPNLQRYKIKWENHLDQSRLESYGLVKKAEIKVILDAGGFQFGDQWSKGYTKENNLKLEEYYKAYKKNNTKIIFLPQAFGSFNEPLAKERMEIVFKYADLIYAREKTSLEHLNQLFGKHEKIKLAPDFTSLLEPDIPLKLYNKVKGGVCLIPNVRMTDQTDAKTATAYLDFLNATAQLICSKNEKMVLLNHESDGDWKLINEIQSKISSNHENIVALNNLDANDVKAVIGHCKLLISSRFHGVVSGLNQLVPTFCTSWSHKYEELLDDYNVAENLLDPLDLKSALAKIENYLDNPQKYSIDSEIILHHKEATENMWKEIIKAINE